MEIQPSANEKAPLKPNKSSPLSSPVKCAQTTSPTPVASSSKVLIITPEQIAKLGLTQQLNKVVQSQVKTKLPATPLKSEIEEVPRKRQVRVSKITIINPKPSDDGNIAKEGLIKSKQGEAWSTLSKPAVATVMKNKLSNLLNVRSAPQISAPGSNNDVKNAKEDLKQTELESLGRKRKRENLEPSSTKLTKASDDDVILVDSPIEVKDHLTELQKVSVIVENANSEAVTLKSDLPQSLKKEDRNLLPVTAPAKATEVKIRRPKMKIIPNISCSKHVAVDSIKSNSETRLLPKGTETAQEQQPNEDLLRITPEDVKHKIHVLSNEQISLPQTYIASLKSRTPESSCVSHSAPIFIYRGPTPNNVDVKPVISLVDIENDEETNFKKEIPDCEISPSETHSIKEDDDCKESVEDDDCKPSVQDDDCKPSVEDDDCKPSVEDVLVKPDLSKTDNSSKSAPSGSDDKEPIADVPNLDKLFVDKDSFLMINDPHFRDVLSDEENKITTNTENSSQNVNTDANQTKNLTKPESNIKPPVIDLTELDEPEKIAPEKVETSQNFPLMKSGVILNFAAKIKNKIADNAQNEFKVNNTMRTYSRKSILAAKLAPVQRLQEVDKRDVDSEPKSEVPIKIVPINPEPKSETPQPIKIGSVNPGASAPKTYSRKLNLAPKLITREKPTGGAANSSPKPEIALNIEASTVKAKPLILHSRNRKSSSSTNFDEEKPKNQHNVLKCKPEISDPLKIEDSIKTEPSAVSNNELESKETKEPVKPTPKKRGRKKKSEMVTPEVPINIPEPEIEISRRGRKRKVVDYFALAEGKEFDAEDSTTAVKKPRRNTSSFSENATEKDGIVQIDTTISRNANGDSVSCTSTAQEITSPPKETPKRKRGRPPRVKVIEEKIDKTNEKIQTDVASATQEKITESGPTGSTDARKPSEDTVNQSSSHEVDNSSTAVDESNKILVEQKTGEVEKKKRRRGRPGRNESSRSSHLISTIFQQINSSVELSQDESANETTVENIESTDNTTAEAVSIKVEVDGDGGSAEKESQDKEQSTKVTKKTNRRGRRNSKSHLVSEIQSPTTSRDGASVTCAICNAVLGKNSWANHKLRFHNNLAWRVGDPPLDLNDQKLVMSVLTDIYKRRKPLFCEKCGDSKKSVLGYLSHKSMCQKSLEELTAMRVKCEFCDRTVLPVSMVAHLRFCKGEGNPHFAGVEENSAGANLEDSPLQGKRKAATKAHDLIKSLREDGTVETTRAKKNTHRWYLNFDFRPTYFGKKYFRSEIAKSGTAKCRFEDCEFETADEDEISNHLPVCDKKPTEGYTCKFCIATCKTETNILEHLKEAHSSSCNPDETSAYEENGEGEIFEEEFEEFDDDDKAVNKSRTAGARPNLLHGIKFLLKHRYCAPGTHIAYPPALEWTLKFCKQNFSIRNLFPNWRTSLENWEKLQPALIARYLPHLKYSACTSLIQGKRFVDPLKLDHEWTRYKLFEANSPHNGTSIIFCGGPIFAMAWAPTPFDKKNCNQILALSANCDADKGYLLGRKYSESGLIQFWNCGPLSNAEGMVELPRLEFCVAHDYGPIWHLEWCPSGCFDVPPNEEHNSLQRLGVLAVGSGNSNIYLYSVCSPGQISGKILKPKPILKLVLDAVVEHPVNDLEAHVTKLSWSKASGHEYLAAGYANGLVAIYYLSTTATLLKLGMDQDGIEMIMPYRVFSAHHHAITALCLYHLNDGRRWILTGSVDRTVKYWDLENPLVPITDFAKYIVTDGVWLNHWLSSLHSFDDSCAGGLTYTLAQQLRNFESESMSVMHSNSRVMTLAGSEWLNGFVQGNVAGELTGFFPHQMFYSMDGDKSFRHKKVILGYTRLVEKDLSIEERVEEEKKKLEIRKNRLNQADNERSATTTPDLSKPEPTTYKTAEEKYGVVFTDMTLDSVKEFTDNIKNYYMSNKSDKLYGTRPNIYPMQSITKVAFNPNQESYLYLASGYQGGFVKISYLEFLKKRPS